MSAEDSLSSYLHGNLPIASIYPVLRDRHPESGEASSEIGIPMCDSHEVRFLAPIPEMGSYYIVNETALGKLGLTTEQLCEVATANLWKLFKAHQETLTLGELLHEDTEQPSGVWEMQYAGKLDDASFVSGLLLLPYFLDGLMSVLVEKAGWSPSAVLAAAVPVRDTVLLFNAEPREDRAAILQTMRNFIRERYDGGGAGDSKPVSDSIIALHHSEDESGWITLME